MKIHLQHLIIFTRRTIERVDFSSSVTFLYGPVSTGKSTVARLIDFCLGGDIERTPAIQQEFVSAQLSLRLGDYECMIERAADDNQSVRISWSGEDGIRGSANAPFDSQTEPLLTETEVYNFSDLIFYLCGTIPIKVRRRTRDPNSPLIRLSIRDVWRYCYLDQGNLDSSFFRLEDQFRGRKSQDAMRYFTGLHSERLSQIETELIRLIDEQRAKRAAVQQIRHFMNRFEFETEDDITEQVRVVELELDRAEQRRSELERTRISQIHPTDNLRNELRHLSAEIEDVRQASAESEELIYEQRALRGELITTKTKAERVHQAESVLSGVNYLRCPKCGSDLTNRPDSDEHCCLCCSSLTDENVLTSLDLEVMRRDLNERIDQIGDSIRRRESTLTSMKQNLTQMIQKKELLDMQLQEELARYDSAFIESIRAVDREIATLTERIKSLVQLNQMPLAINEIEEEAGALQGLIDRLRTSLDEERGRLRNADENIAAIASEFKRIMLSVSFPGVSEDDEVVLDPRNWKPTIIHGQQEWTFSDTGSGGKKTLFNVCYALALHSVAIDNGMPVPNVLIIDSPTKNISEDENPELINLLYAEIYRFAERESEQKIQFLLIDSDLVEPDVDIPDFYERRIAGEPDAPSLISYYTGP